MRGFFARPSYYPIYCMFGLPMCVFICSVFTITMSAWPSDLLVYCLLGLFISSFMSLINSMLRLHYVTVWKWLHKAGNRLAGCSIRVPVKHQFSVTSCFPVVSDPGLGRRQRTRMSSYFWPISIKNKNETRMHSSGMRTVRCSGRRGEGCLPGAGECLPGE